MATSQEYVDFCVQQIASAGFVQAKKMFGEYMIYVDQKPLILVCNNTCYIKMWDELKPLMANAPTAIPYEGCKLYYILDIEDKVTLDCLKIMWPIQSFPKKRNKNKV